MTGPSSLIHRKPCRRRPISSNSISSRGLFLAVITVSSLFLITTNLLNVLSSPSNDRVPLPPLPSQQPQRLQQPPQLPPPPPRSQQKAVNSPPTVSPPPLQSARQEARILLLDAHMEGNLGDEMETTPVLWDWFCDGSVGSDADVVSTNDESGSAPTNTYNYNYGCGSPGASHDHDHHNRRPTIHVTVALSPWQQHPRARLHSRTSRQHGMVGTFRTLEEVAASMSHNNNNNSSNSSHVTEWYDLIVVAPGPWKACELRQVWPHRIDVYLGGSFVEDPLCDGKVDTTTTDRKTNIASMQPKKQQLQPQRQEQPPPALVIVREPVSLELAVTGRYFGTADATSTSTATTTTTTTTTIENELTNTGGTTFYMGGDFSYSYHPAVAALEYWKNYYRRLLAGSGEAAAVAMSSTKTASSEERPHKPVVLVFSRANNFNKGVRIMKDRQVSPQQQANTQPQEEKENGVEEQPAYTVLLKRVTGDKVRLSTRDHRIVFCSSSDVEDGGHFQMLARTYPRLFSNDDGTGLGTHLIIAQSVEELWGLLSQGSMVYTDRYHPGVAAHIMGIPFDVLFYEAEQTKLNGLAQLVKGGDNGDGGSGNSTSSFPMDVHTLRRRNRRAFQMVRDLLWQRVDHRLLGEEMEGRG